VPLKVSWIELTFADEDVQVIAVGNGQEAIDRVQRDPPDIVLADVGMPERNGYEVAAFVKGNPDTAHIPVVLLTGAFEPVDEGRARAVGCDGILVKPFEPQLVISRVKDLLAGRQPAGMWSSSTGTTAAATEPFAGSPAQPPSAVAAQHRDTIPLSRRPAPPPPRTNSGDPLAGWDPDLIGDPARPAAIEPVQPAPRAMTPAVASPAPAAPPPSALPASLVDAFTALLSAEQKLGLSPSAAAAPSGAAGSAPTAITDDMIDAVAERVLAKLSTQSRPAILDVAERLVREEIERLKQ
jgi:CheY-like chemotaxis protein